MYHTYGVGPALPNGIFFHSDPSSLACQVTADAKLNDDKDEG